MEDTKIIIKPDLEDCEEKKDTFIKGSGVISKHIKRRVLLELEQYGCTSQTLKIASAVRRTDNTEAIKAEENVEKECNSLSFHNMSKWLELMKETKLSTLCEYEAAAVMNSIVRNEPQPKPDLLNGINLTELYKFLENALIGQPQKTLCQANQAFLFREFTKLIAEANTDESDVEAKEMGQTLYYCEEFNYMAEPQKASMDPLFLDKSK